MRHFYSFILLAVLSSIAGTNAWAYDFVADGIFYNITSAEDLTVEVTSNVEKYSGDVVIPATVEYDGKTYSVKRIGESAFENCSALTSIVIPESVTIISFYAFASTGLTSITIPEGVTWIASTTFRGCTGLTSIVVSPNNNVFDSRNNCNAIIWTSSNSLLAGCQNSFIPDGVKSIGDYAFYGCTGLTSIEIPSSVKSIGGWAFYGCRSLTSIEIPNSVTSIGRSAFDGCAGLTSVEIPSSVTSIGNAAFFQCSGLTSVVIPSSVTSISSSAFDGCRHLTSIEIPNSVTSIGDYAFRWCADLTSIEIPSSVTSIGDCAFNYCYGLTSIEIPSSVTSIGNYAFCECIGLTSIEIPSSVTSIGERAFVNCSGLTSIEVASGNSAYDSRNNCNAIIETATNKLIAGCQNSFIPDGVTSIGSEAFSSCTGLTSIEIPSSVTSIGVQAFYKCTGLTSIEIPNSVTSIGDYAFNSVRCVIYMGEATGSPWGANKVYTTFPDEYGFIYADEEKTQIEYYAGSGGDVIIPDGVTTLPNSLFSGLKGITSVTIPTSVTSIDGYAFSGCSGLTSIEIPSSVTSIGRYAFQNCTGLTAIYLNWLVPPTIDYYTFYGLDLSNCTLYVPEGFESDYQNANYWKNFTNIAVNPYVTVEKKAVIYVVDGEEYHRDSVVVTTAITALDAPTREGYTFSGWSEIPATMPDNDVTVTGSFTVNTHNIIYVVDGTEYQKVENVAFGTTLAIIDAPTREGYTFSGWSEIPATMPDNDVTVTGTFTVNTHNIIYVVDGTEYQKVENVAFGTTLSAIDAPTREGYTFSGWSEIPTTMPDNDVTVTGTFTINKYAVIYMVDGEEYRRDSVEYGATITLAENPTKESHDFSGWSGYPENLTMPAGDVIITGGFQFNGLAGVAAATIGDEYFDLTGKPLSQPQRGINLVRKADGTTRKIIVK